MWSCDRRTLLIGLLALPGCGFRPLYGEGSPAAALLGRVAIGTITYGETPGRMDYTLTEELRSRLGRNPANPLWRLDLKLKVDRTGLAISEDNATTRYNLTGRADWTLTATGTATPAESGSATSFTAYSATSSVYATRIAARDAEKRMATDLADRIVSAIATRAGQLPA